MNKAEVIDFCYSQMMTDTALEQKRLQLFYLSQLYDLAQQESQEEIKILKAKNHKAARSSKSKVWLE